MNTKIVILVSLFILVLFFLIEKVIKQKQQDKNLYLSMMKFIRMYEFQEIDYINRDDYSIYESKRKAILNNIDEYPYCYVVFGKFNLENDKEIDFGMTFGFKNKRDITYGEATCLEYLNPTTGKKYNYVDTYKASQESIEAIENIIDTQINI